MARSRSGLRWIFIAFGVVVVAMAGMWVLRAVRGQALHANPLAIPSAVRGEPSAQWAAAVDRSRRAIRDAVAEQNLPGLSVAVGVGDGVVWTEGFGWADIELRMPVTPETRFRMGTASTALTSAAAGVLVEKGRLKLDEQIQTYVPQFPKKQWPVTLRQLMADVGGAGTDGVDDGPLFRQRCEGPVEALPHFAKDALLFEPGTRYQHSTYGWILVSAAVEAAAGQPFLQFMGEAIFQPLGMNHTGAETAKEENPERIGEPEEDPPFMTAIQHLILKPLGVGNTKIKRATEPATIYAPGFGFQPQAGYSLHVMRLHNLSCYSGSMAFFSTASDLVRFGLAMNGGKLLQPATVRLLQTPQTLASGKETGYGLGWKFDNATVAGKPTQAAGQDGELLGRRVVSLRMFRESRIVVAVMANYSHADTSALALKVAEAFAQPAPK